MYNVDGPVLNMTKINITIANVDHWLRSIHPLQKTRSNPVLPT